MQCSGIILVVGWLVHSATAVWLCTSDDQCSSLSGSICSNGSCVCPPGQQSVFGGSLCVDLAPYHTSSCVEEHQCYRLTTAFQCQSNEGQEGQCFCQPGHHYFLGRCWPTTDFGETCVTSEECLSVLRDPYSLTCNGTCVCAEGYYERQKGECRKIGAGVGDGCVLDSDCQFEGGYCDYDGEGFRCASATIDSPPEEKEEDAPMGNPPVQHGVSCDVATPCTAPFECSQHDVCLCPVGYYPNAAGNICLAELGSPATASWQCTGLLAEVRDGICTCPVNFFYEENMRDCIKVTRTMQESCVSDANCHTFGAAARCGPPQDPWGMRTCECDPDEAVWDAALEMCRLFAGIGEACEVDSDCLAGELEIQCVQNDDGQGYCTCPEGLLAVGGLCLTTGLGLGDTCQAAQECTAIPNLACESGLCSCDSTGYQEVDGGCAPIIGGVCASDSDCVIQNTVCANNTGSWSCQCADNFVEYDQECWPVAVNLESPCNITAQCTETLGEGSSCEDGKCICAQNYHLRDGGCWPIIGLFEVCRRSSECYLSGYSERVVCRNSLCQCEFDYPYSEELQTCTSPFSSSSSSACLNMSLLISALMYLARSNSNII